MRLARLTLLATVAATPLLSQEAREMDAHVHGVSTLELAVEGNVVEIDLLSPGMDIVGFEYEAGADADKDAVEAAIRVMLVPENILTLPDTAQCRLTGAMVHLHAGDHDHAEGEDHDHAGDAAHDEHAEGEAHEEHATGEDHDHAQGGEHSEFHAGYSFACAHPEELTLIRFPFFDRFAGAQEIEAQYVTANGAGSAEIGRDAAELTLN